jgi:hypothetical protein
MTITTKRRIGIDTDGRITGRGRHIAYRERDYRKKKMRREDGRARSDLVFRVDSSSCAVQPRNGTVVRAHLGRAGQEHKMDPHGMIRLAERTAVGEGK